MFGLETVAKSVEAVLSTCHQYEVAATHRKRIGEGLADS